MRVARKGKDLWFVLSEDEVSTHGFELGDEVTFARDKGKVFMEVAKQPRRDRSPQKG